MAERYPTDPCPQDEYVETIGLPAAETRYRNGTRQVARLTTTSIYSFSVSYSILTIAQMDVLWDFYVARQGIYESFEFESLRDGLIYIVSFTQPDMNRSQFQYNAERTGLTMMEDKS